MWSNALFSAVPLAWRPPLESRLRPDVMARLAAFVACEMETHTVFPPAPHIFRALQEISPDQTRVVILGQDPYPTRGHAHGLAFSVHADTKLPRSLSNIFRELEDDLGMPAPANGDLSDWAKQGVLLLNAVLTVREGEAGSHRNQGWEHFTDAILASLNDSSDHLVFVLWGADAQKKKALLDAHRHTLLSSAHPSPLSARRGFWKSRPFTKINDALIQRGGAPIAWTQASASHEE